MRYLFLLLPFLLGCSHQPKPGSHAFYYWKFEEQGISDSDTALIKQLQVAHFYIHYFDVDWSEARGKPLLLLQYCSFFEGELLPGGVYH